MGYPNHKATDFGSEPLDSLSFLKQTEPGTPGSYKFLTQM